MVTVHQSGKAGKQDSRAFEHLGLIPSIIDNYYYIFVIIIILLHIVQWSRNGL